MTKTLLAIAALSLAANVAPAQLPGAAAKAAAQKAAAAANSHIEAEQGPTKASAQKPAAKQPQAPTKTQPAPTKATGQKSGAGNQKSAGGAQGAAVQNPADTAGPPPTIYREAYAYGADGRRDPFNSLLTTNELRPTLSDLRITGILYDPAGRSWATLRDIVTNAQHRITTGSTLGRMRVAGIRPRIVVFTIDEFGTTRQDSLVFGDTTKARVK